MTQAAATQHQEPVVRIIQFPRVAPLGNTVKDLQLRLQIFLGLRVRDGMRNRELVGGTDGLPKRSETTQGEAGRFSLQGMRRAIHEEEETLRT